MYHPEPLTLVQKTSIEMESDEHFVLSWAAAASTQMMTCHSQAQEHTPLIQPAANPTYHVHCGVFFPVCVLAVKIFQLGLFIAPARRKEYLEISINPHTHTP